MKRNAFTLFTEKHLRVSGPARLKPAPFKGRRGATGEGRKAEPPVFYADGTFICGNKT